MRWIGVIIGYLVGQIPGAILGFLIGGVLQMLTRKEPSGFTIPNPSNANPLAEDFEVNLLLLSAYIIKADGKTTQRELDFVRSYFKKTYGEHRSQMAFKRYKQLSTKEMDKSSFIAHLGQRMNTPSKLHLIHYLFSIAVADHQLSPSEIDEIRKIALLLGLSFREFNSIFYLFYQQKREGSETKTDATQKTKAYKILGVEANATQKEIKQAFRKLAKIHHPDRVTHLGETHRKIAEEKFKQIQAAYQSLI